MPIVKGFLSVIGFTFLFWLAAGRAVALVQPFSLLDSPSDEAFGSIHVQGMNEGKNLSSPCASITGATFELMRGQFASILTYGRFFNSPLLCS